MEKNVNFDTNTRQASLKRKEEGKLKTSSKRIKIENLLNPMTEQEIKSFQAAQEALRKAQIDLMEAYYNLAQRFEEGNGCFRSESDAGCCYKRAADLKHVIAQRRVSLRNQNISEATDI